jgi:flagellar biosynthetic protein FliO
MALAASAELPETMSWWHLGRVLVFLALLLAAASWLRRRWGRRTAGGGPLLRLVSTLPLGDKRALAVVEVESRRVLIGIGPHQVRLLCRLGPSLAPPEAVSHASAPATPVASFLDALMSARSKRSRTGQQA